MKIAITVDWWCALDQQEPIEEHHDALQAVALDEVVRLIGDGYREGQLLTQIEGVDYRGYWFVTTEASTTAQARKQP